MSKKIIIAGGGTGGHVYPALAIAEGLVESGVPQSDILFIGSRHSMEKTVVPDAGFSLLTLPGKGLNRGELIRNIFHALQIIYACLSVTLRFVANRPKLVIGVGGYASVPALIAASLLRINRIVHEQNSVVGRTNALAARWGADMFTTWDDTQGAPQRSQTMGLPMRTNMDDALKAREDFLSTSHTDFTVTVSGGSLGAKIINETVISMIEQYDIKMTIVHITGSKNYDECVARYREIGSPSNVIVHSYRDDINTLYARSSVVVSRAGAGTCADLETLQVQCVLIPLPSAPGNHQYLNAQHLADKEQAYVLEQSDLSAQNLYELLVAEQKKSRGIESFEPYRFHLESRRRIADYIVQHYLSALRTS